MRPPSTPPTIGATQNSHNCCNAQPPAISAGPVLRAGLTDVLVTGMQIKWISVSDSPIARSEEHTSELQSLMRISYAVFCLKKKTNTTHSTNLTLPHLYRITT